MGFSVPLFETIAWAEELLDPRPPPPCAGSPASTPRPVSCFTGRAKAARANAHRATVLERDERYEACPPRYASFIEALGAVYCGDLDHYVELTGEVRGGTGTSAATDCPPTSTGSESAGRAEEALALTEESVAVGPSAIPTGTRTRSGSPAVAFSAPSPAVHSRP